MDCNDSPSQVDAGFNEVILFWESMFIVVLQEPAHTDDISIVEIERDDFKCVVVPELEGASCTE